MYQVYGMIGLPKSIAKGWNWLWNLYRGPIQKLQDAPRPRLELVSPPLASACELVPVSKSALSH